MKFSGSFYVFGAYRIEIQYVTSYCGDIHLILHMRIDDLSDFISTASTEYGEREESLAERGELGVLSSHHDSVTLIVTVKLLGRNKVVRHLVQPN